MIEIKSRWTGAVIYKSDTAATLREALLECVAKAKEIGARADLAGADLAGADLAGADLAGAYLARADLAGANLAGAYLAGANLAGAYLAGAYLARADLAGAYLAGAYLAGADLARADLAGADLAGAYLAGADLAGADLAGADLAGAVRSGEVAEPYKPSASRAERMARYRERHPEVPVVEGLDRKILDAVTVEGGTLDMSTWHVCETTHCRAGWAITKAGEAGKKLEQQFGPQHAASMIYRASTGRVPHFFATNEAAMADIKRCAEEAAEPACPAGKLRFRRRCERR